MRPSWRTCSGCSAIRPGCASCSPASIADRLELNDSLVGHHLRLLRAARVVRAERHGKQVFYSAADEHIRRVVMDLLEHAAEPRPEEA
jgi:DNA-binding transcriptional ArsR family regulator